MVLEISQNSQENTCAREFLIKLRSATLFKRDTLALVFSCEFCEISKNTFFIEQHRWYWEISCIVKLKDRPQISRLILREFKQINELLSPPEIIRKPMVADHFKRVIEVN